MRRTGWLLRRESLRELAVELLGVVDAVPALRKKNTVHVKKDTIQCLQKIEEVDVRVAVMGVFRRGHSMKTSDDVIAEVQTVLRRVGYGVEAVTGGIWSELIEKVKKWRVGAVVPLLKLLGQDAGIVLDKKTYLETAKKFGELKQLDNALQCISLSLHAHPPCTELLTVMVYCYKKVNDFPKALNIFLEYWKSGVQPDIDAFSMLISASGDLPTGITIYKTMLRNNLVPGEYAVVALMECCVKSKLLTSAGHILKTSKRLGCDHSQSLWLQYIRVHRHHPSKFPMILDIMRQKSIPLTTPIVFLILSYLSHYATTIGNAAVLHAERVFAEALGLPLHNPGQMYSEMVAVYANSQDHEGVERVVEMVREKYPGNPPYLFKKRVRKYNGRYGRKLVV